MSGADLRGDGTSLDSAGYGRLPRIMVSDKRISFGAKGLFAVLRMYAYKETGWPGYEAICDDTDASEKTVRRWIQELRAAGYVTMQRRGLGLTNVCILAETCASVGLEPYDPERSKCPIQTGQNSRSGPGESPVQDPPEIPALVISSAGGSGAAVLNGTSPPPELDPTVTKVPSAVSGVAEAGSRFAGRSDGSALQVYRDAVSHDLTASEAPARPAPPKNKIAEVIDAVRAAGLRDPDVSGRHGKAVKGSPYSAAEIAEAYVAAYRGSWGNDWLRANLNLYSVCDRIAGYQASKGEHRNATSTGPYSNGTARRVPASHRSVERLGSEIQYYLEHGGDRPPPGWTPG